MHNVQVCVYVNIYIYTHITYIHTYIYIYIYIYIYTSKAPEGLERQNTHHTGFIPSQKSQAWAASALLLPAYDSQSTRIQSLECFSMHGQVFLCLIRNTDRLRKDYITMQAPGPWDMGHEVMLVRTVTCLRLSD